MNDGDGILTPENCLDAFHYASERLPIAADRQGVAILRVTVGRTPVARTNLLDQLRRYGVTLEGKRVVGISDIEGIEVLEVGRGVFCLRGRRREGAEDGLAHGRPEGADAIVGPGARSGGGLREGVGLVNKVTGLAHGPK